MVNGPWRLSLSLSPDSSDLCSFGREAENDQVSRELLAYFVLGFHIIKWKSVES